MKISKKYYILVLIILISGLRCNTEFKTILYKVYDYDGEKITNYTYRMKIPKGYKLIIVSFDAVVQHEYWYPDSSVIYLTNELGLSNINYENIRKEKGEYVKRMIAFIYDDTITLSGKDSTGLYWKEIKLKSICVGYSRVAENKKNIFDFALKTLITR